MHSCEFSLIKGNDINLHVDFEATYTRNAVHTEEFQEDI